MIFDFKDDKATDAQLSYIETLIAHVQEIGTNCPVDDEQLDRLTKAEASEMIDTLKIILGWE